MSCIYHDVACAVICISICVGQNSHISMSTDTERHLLDQVKNQLHEYALFCIK